jgi:homoserine kinase
VIVRAPASTANLGPGFDCAAAALDLWNEVHVEEGAHEVVVEGEGAGELRTDDGHLTLRAFSLLADPERYRFRFVNRIPLERGLGSSAAAIAAGLVAGRALTGHDIPTDELLRLGLPLEGHADNLAAALEGGVCLIWRNGAGPHTARIAVDLPLSPVLVVPDQRVSTSESRGRLPKELPLHRQPCSARQSPRATPGCSPTPFTTVCTSPTAWPTRRSWRS